MTLSLYEVRREQRRLERKLRFRLWVVAVLGVLVATYFVVYTLVSLYG